MVRRRSSGRTIDLVAAKKVTVLDENGKGVSFGKLLDQQDGEVQRTLVIFIRHFFCGNCQEYLRRLASDLSPSKKPADLSIVIIGCGAPSLIPSYIQITKCPFPIYADPSTELYRHLGMRRNLSLGGRDPDYIRHSLAYGALKSIVQGLKRIPAGDVMQAGDMSVNGGEFLFERSPLLSRPSSDTESNASVRSNSTNGWRISWSHCMLNTRDHAEMQDLVSALENNEIPPEEQRGRLPSKTKDDCACGSKTSAAQSGEEVTRRSFSERRRTWMCKASNVISSSHSPHNQHTSLRQSMIQVT